MSVSDHSDTFDVNADALGRMLAETAADFVCLATARGEPYYLNPAARAMLGLNESQATDTIALRDLYAEHSWAELRDVGVPAVNKLGRWEGRSRLHNKRSGEFIDVQTTMLRIKSNDPNRPPSLAFIHRHTDDRSRLRTLLADAQARKRALVESALDAVITINHAGIITEFNKAAEQIFAYPREKVLGTKPSDVLFPAGMSNGQQDRIERYLDPGESSTPGKRIEVTAVRADGQTFDAEMIMLPGREQGALVITFFVRDISLQKKAEQEQAHHAADVARSNRELEHFAYVASHDLQEPLKKLRSFGERLRARCGERLDDVGSECLQRMMASAERMQTLVDGLLSLSRVSTQGQRFVPVDLAQIVRGVVSELRTQIEQLGGRVEVGHLPTIEAAPQQMQQLLQNLIANSLKFHRVDEPPLVKVSGKLVHGRRQRGPGQPSFEEQCQITVEDNGIGFEEKQQDRSLGAFQQLHQNVFEGTGIGLALCRKIVDCHGGEFTARSTPGRGSVVEITLPVSHNKKGAALGPRVAPHAVRS